MRNRGLLLASGSGLLLFAVGYIIGSLRHEHQTDAGNIPSKPARTADGNEGHELRSEQASTRSAFRSVDQYKAGYQRLIDLVGARKIQISEVDIKSSSFMPGDKVADFFSLNESQLDELKRIGGDRLQKRREREFERASISQISEGGMVAEIPADPEFARSEIEGFIEDLRRNFSPDLAAILRPSIENAYSDLAKGRHVEYTLNLRPIPEHAANSTPETQARYEGIYDFTLKVDHYGAGGNKEGGTTSGSRLDTKKIGPDLSGPRYHDLWQRALKKH